MASDYDWLKDGKIVAISDGEMGISLEITLADPVVIATQVVKTVELQVWQDPEGNGPGYLALTRADP